MFLECLMSAAAVAPTLITESVHATATAAHGVRIADTIIGHWETSNYSQPHRSYVESVHRVAIDACRSLADVAPVPMAATWLERLGPRLGQSAMPIVCEDDWKTFIEQIVNAACGSNGLSHGGTGRCAIEIAAILVERQQSPRLLERSLVRLFSSRHERDSEPRELITKHLVGTDRQHVALLGVTGARELPGLCSASADVTLRQIHPHLRHQFRGWGNAGGRGQDFARGLASGRIDIGEAAIRSTAPHAFVSVWVRAPDTRAALEKSRVALSEALDQYVVAHPTARLAIEPIAASADPISAGSFWIDDARGNPIGELSPLTVPWPAQLLIALRMTALMRASVVPVTRAALCWVVMESAGMRPGPSTRELVAKSLALASLRQLHLRSFVDLVVGSRANSGERRRHERRATILRSRARRHLRTSPTVQQSPKLHLAGMRFSVASALHSRVAVLAEQDAQRTRGLLNELAVSAVNSDGAPSARLRSFQAWARLLRRHSTTSPATTSDHALHTLMVKMRPHQRTLLESVQEADASPESAMALLSMYHSWFEEMTAQLYVCRNLHLHSGVHELDGGVALGAIGPMMVDALFEIWAIWYRKDSALSPVEVLKLLAQRFDYCTARLNDGIALEKLDLAELAGPDWTPEDAP